MFVEFSGEEGDLQGEIHIDLKWKIFAVGSGGISVVRYQVG